MASGAVPRQLTLPPNPHVVTVRDQNSVENLAALLKHDAAVRRRVVLIGGGGIAMELARHPVLRNCDVVWVSCPSRPSNVVVVQPRAPVASSGVFFQVVKDDIVGKHYLDDVASRFDLHSAFTCRAQAQ